MAFDFNENNVKDYLVSVGLLDYGDVLSVETLGWGISNTLIKVLTPTRNMVVKQSLEYLRVKEVWKADRKRIYTERECISLLEQVLEPGSFPEIIYEDRSNFLFVMSSAPEGSINWKELLMSGEISSEMAEESGKLLKLFHSLDVKSLGSNELFNNLDSFIELRIDPYHRTVARLHSDVSNIVEREAERMLDTQVTLVHGDYRNGNFLFKENKITGILDWEMAHIGDPLEDLGWALSPIWSWQDPSKPAYLIDRQASLSVWEGSSGLTIDKNDLKWWELFVCVKGMAIWISAGNEFKTGKNVDPINLFSPWIPGDIHLEIILDILEEDLNET